MGEGGDCTRARLLLLHSARVQECRSERVSRYERSCEVLKYLHTQTQDQCTSPTSYLPLLPSPSPTIATPPPLTPPLYTSYFILLLLPVLLCGVCIHLLPSRHKYAIQKAVAPSQAADVIEAEDVRLVRCHLQLELLHPGWELCTLHTAQ